MKRYLYFTPMHHGLINHCGRKWCTLGLGIQTFFTRGPLPFNVLLVFGAGIFLSCNKFQSLCLHECTILTYSISSTGSSRLVGQHSTCTTSRRRENHAMDTMIQTSSIRPNGGPREGTAFIALNNGGPKSQPTLLTSAIHPVDQPSWTLNQFHQSMTKPKSLMFSGTRAAPMKSGDDQSASMCVMKILPHNLRD
jgi:hypothetical protein